MEQNRVKSVESLNTATKAVSNRKKASAEFVMAAQLNQTRETVIALRRQVAEQEHIISTLQNQVAFLEVQNLQRENEKLRDEHGLKIGQKLEKDASGEWWIVDEAPTGASTPN